MTSIIAAVMILIMLFLLVKNKTTPAVVLIGIPFIAAIVLGFSLPEIGGFITKGISKVTNIVAMFIFAIMYFGVVSDAGMFDAFIKKLIKFAKNNILSVTLVTVLIGMIAHLEGVGAATFLITIPAMLPIYKRLKMRPESLVLLVGAAAGIMNIVPWGGPTLRAATALDMNVVELWKPLIPLQVIGFIFAFVLAYIIAKMEIKNGAGYDKEIEVSYHSANKEDLTLQRPKMLWFNVVLTILAIIALVSSILPPAIVFMVAMCIALPINYPNVKIQAEILKKHAPGAMLMAITLMAAGAFLGILAETKMVDEIAKDLVTIIPSFLSPYLHIVMGILGAPIGMALGPDPYYFGLLPIIKEIVAHYGIAPTAVAHAMLLGENVGFAVSPVIPTVYLAIGLAGVDLGTHIKHSFLWLWMLSLVMLSFGVLFGIIPI